MTRWSFGRWVGASIGLALASSSACLLTTPLDGLSGAAATADGGASPGDYQGPCFPNATCNVGLVCTQGICLHPQEAPDGGGTGDGGAASDAGNPTATTCTTRGPGLSDCGRDGGEDCCVSPLVAGGTFSRSYDRLTYNDATNSAQVSNFRLDRFEVTVGRFRKFVNAVVGGWTPPVGSGKHTHLNGGTGLRATGGGYEAGWDAAWNADLPATLSAWTGALSCDATYQTWTPAPGNSETRPIVCEKWDAAYAFCIWDGGFLPTEAEWNYAAAGGGGIMTGQRVYPWSSPPKSTTIDCAHANYGGASWPSTACVAAGPNKVGTESPAGDGAFGQADLAGNVREWCLDWWYLNNYVTPCDDCVASTTRSDRVSRGGSFDVNAHDSLPSFQDHGSPAIAYAAAGVRCARAP